MRASAQKRAPAWVYKETDKNTKKGDIVRNSISKKPAFGQEVKID